MSYNIKKLFIILNMILIFLTSCSTNSNPIKEEVKGWSVQKLYLTANYQLNKSNYNKAIKLYEELQSSFPYGIYAQEGLLDLSYAYYQNNDIDKALTSVAEFINTYPTNKNIDYALYLQGYINFKNDNGLLSKYTGQDLSERDNKSEIDALNSFMKLVNQYPQSKYYVDARKKINILINALSRGELYRARYYMTIRAYLAAISRTQDLINQYPNTIFVEEALAIEIMAYKKLNMPDMSNTIYNILKLNFKDSYYLTHEWKNKDIVWYKFWR